MNVVSHFIGFAWSTETFFCVGHIWKLFQFARPRIYAQGEESNHFYILEDTALTLPEKYFLSLIDMIVAPVCFVVMYIYVYI